MNLVKPNKIGHERKDDTKRQARNNFR